MPHLTPLWNHRQPSWCLVDKVCPWLRRGLMYTGNLPSTRKKWNCDSLNHTRCQPLRVQLMRSRDQMRHCDWPCGVNKASFCVFLSNTVEEAKEQRTDMLHMSLVPPALNVDWIWARVACLLRWTIPAKYLWLQSLTSRDWPLRCPH